MRFLIVRKQVHSYVAIHFIAKVGIMPTPSSSYPYEDVKTLFESCRGCTIAQFAKQVRDVLGHRLNAVKFAEIPFPGRMLPPILIDDIDIDNTILMMSTINLASFLLFPDVELQFGRLIQWAEKTKDPYLAETISLLVQRITGEDDTSIISMVHLAYYEAHLYRNRQIEGGNLVLPGQNDCKILLQLAKRAAGVLVSHPGLACKVGFTGGYSHTVNRGAVNFITDNAVWGLRLHSFRPKANDGLYLMIAYMLAKRSVQYKDTPLQFIRILNPVMGITYSLDMKSVDPQLLMILENGIYGPSYPDPSIITLSRQQQSRLVMAMVCLLDVRHQGSLSVADEIHRLCPLTVDPSTAKLLYDPVVRHFVAPWPTKETAVLFRKSILLLNQLFYYFDNPTAPLGITVTLAEDLVTDTLKKALDY